ncbi:hypothetical protein MSG28_004930 [Choristoneura fumiferana]|uniref:Uncharacterized protein n=1 Tax=Choristoneura fumiferana TaxID=7141 RepID=A0ACC0JP61_CHOFU|nr:hypothetical protein MSG28_004930 [Choristoneura fumiferana]
MVSYSKKSSAEWFIDQLNVGNAKLVAFVLVLGFIGYHGILHLRYGRYKGDHEWQPYGCMLHRYSKTDARRCLRYLAFWGKYNSFAFIGDSRIEQLYEYFIGVLKARTELDTTYTMDHRSPNYTYSDAKLRLSVRFVWSDDVSRTMVEQQHEAKPPSVIVAGTGLQLLKTRNATDLVIDEYKRNLTLLVQAVDSLAAKNSQVLWKLIESVDSTKLKNDYKKISNSDIDEYNRAAVEILTHSAAKIWSSPRLVAQGSGSGSSDGWALSARALRHDAQILLNMFCNDHMNFPDGSCCALPESGTTLQLLTFSIAVLAAIKVVWQWSQTIHQRLGGYSLVNQPIQPSNPSPLAALAKLGMIMSYFYLCDRTNFFMKENKYYSEWSFWLPVGYVFALGLVLHREQTNEWKGWMQLVILVYQVTGASKVLPIYMLVRALVSAYLFLTGYGHFTYTWKTGDTCLVRYFRVIFRLNFLTVVLCLTMNRPYQFYTQRYSILDDNNHSNLFTPGVSLSATLVAFIGLGSYVTYTFFCTNIFDCNEIHSYVAFLPIVSYILLRNVSGALRTRHSSLFAWFGTITLELFASQSHIWLAADTHGVLVLVPSAPILNLIITSYIFICAAHEIHKLTTIILPYAVPDDWRLVLRNFAIFLAILLQKII